MRTDNLKMYKLMGTLRRVLTYILLLLFAMMFILPFLFLLTGSFKTSSELFSTPIKWIPEHPTLDNFKQVFTNIPFFLFLRNTLILVVAAIVGSSISCSLVAYGFSRLKWPGRDKVFMIVIATMVLPYQVTLIPMYLLYTKIKWVNTFMPLIIPQFFGNAFFIFLMRQFLIGIPKEITESARIDGANEFTIFLKVIMPVSKPVLTTVIIMAFLNSWKDFLGPLLYLGSDKLYTLSLAASLLKSNLDPNWEILMALGVLMVTPVLILFFFMQKYFIQGITMTGIKG